MNDARKDDDLFRFASLDAGEGPAAPLSNDAADVLVRGVLDAALPPPTPGTGPSTSSGITPGKALVGLATIALVVGGVVWSRRTPEPVHTPAPTSTPTATTATEAPMAPVEVAREVVPLPTPPVVAVPREAVAQPLALRSGPADDGDAVAGVSAVLDCDVAQGPLLQRGFNGCLGSCQP
jgi:hypothetical protein